MCGCFYFVGERIADRKVFNSSLPWDQTLMSTIFLVEFIKALPNDNFEN